MAGGERGSGRMAESDNPALPGSLRIFSGAVILVLLVGGGLFFVPDMVKPRWPWPLAPFNARFLGSFYLAEMVAMVALLVWNRWSPARMILVDGVRLHAGGDGHLARRISTISISPQSVLALVRRLRRLGDRGGPVPVERPRHAAGRRHDVGRRVAAAISGWKP